MTGGVRNQLPTLLTTLNMHGMSMMECPQVMDIVVTGKLTTLYQVESQLIYSL